MKIVSRDSFTLTELLIVLLIISLMYGLYVQKVVYQSPTQRLTLQNLPRYLQSIEFSDSVEIVCTEGCKECFLYRDGKKSKKIDLFKTPPVVYDFDQDGLISKVIFPPFFDGDKMQELCFRFQLRKNRSHSSYIVFYNKKFYIYDAYLNNVQIARTLQEAQQLFDHSRWLPYDTQAYNF